jgi:hypothetical protein
MPLRYDGAPPERHEFASDLLSRPSGTGPLCPGVRDLVVGQALTAASRVIRAAFALILIAGLAGSADVSAHRRDEYLQAARVAIDPSRVQLELDLTPGIALAEAIIADVDVNRDGALSADEQRAYGNLVLSALDFDVDGRRLPLEMNTSSFPGIEALRAGEGAIRLHAAAALPPLASGAHQLLFRNRHHPDRSVYLANALVPENNRVAITAQRRDGSQSELTIEYELRDVPGASRAVWFFGSIAVAAVLSALLMRVSRSFR